MPLAISAMHLAGPVPATAPVPPPIRMVSWRLVFPIRPASLPLGSSRNGNLFADRNDPDLHWYLPDFSLAAGTDSSFAFSATQKSQQKDASPFNTGRLIFSIKKSVPADVAQFVQTNPAAKLQEIPLANLTAVLASPYTDSTGQQQTRTFSATSITDAGGGVFQVLFDEKSILGDSVVGLYQDLRVFGQATVALSATFQTWSTPGAPAPPSGLRVNYMAIRMAPAISAAPQVAAARPAPATVQPPPFRGVFAGPGAMGSIRPIAAAPVVSKPAPPPPQPPPPQPPPPQLVEASQPFSKNLGLGLKYNEDGYQLQYTVTTLTAPTRVILSAKDLSEFNAAQSQYAELKELGDISARYPSIARAYIGALSRSIILIPQRYAIVRSKGGCAATCLARADSSAASTSQCAFEFTFVVAPQVDRIELAQFQNEVQGSANLKGYEVTFASLLRDTPASTLQTAFQSATTFAAGADPHTFSVTVSIQDSGPAAPAVANANLFILRLCSQTGTDLIGSLSLKLDDGFTQPVPATLDLNFARTAGSDELGVALDSTAGEIHLSNVSPLDLRVTKYALQQGSTVTVVQDSFVLPAQSGRTLPLPASNAGISLLAEAELALPTPMTTAARPNYLTFQTVDVQETQYLIAIDASGVDFGKVAAIAGSVTFASLPSIAPLTFNLRPNVRTESQHVLIPLADALSTLPGTVQLNVSFADSAVSGVQLSITNDFVTEPVVDILQNQIAAQLHG